MDFEQVSGYANMHDQKAFYDDRYKLLALFPLNLANQIVFKEAPFDVTESRPHFMGEYGYWWSSTDDAYFLSFRSSKLGADYYIDDYTCHGDDRKNCAFSVKLVKDSDKSEGLGPY